MKLVPWAIEAYCALALAWRATLCFKRTYWTGDMERRAQAEYDKMLDEGMRERRIRTVAMARLADRNELARNRLERAHASLRAKYGDAYYEKHYAGTEDRLLDDPWYREVLSYDPKRG